GRGSGAPRSTPSCGELDLDAPRQDAGGGAAIEEEGDGAAPFGAVVARPLVDVHADEAVGAAALEAPPELHGVGDRLLAVTEAVLDARPEERGHPANRLLAEVLAHGVPAERQRQSGLALSPRAEIDQPVQAVIGVGQLPFVDDQPRLVPPVAHRLEYLVEAHPLGPDRAEREPQSQRRRSQPTG